MPDDLASTPPLPAGLGPLTDVEPLKSSPGSHVWRVRLGGELAVVKQIIGPGANARFAREVAALRLAGPLAPEILGADDGQHVVVLEHLDGNGDFPPWDAYVDALARLHARGRFADDSPAELPAATVAGPADVDAFARLCSALDVDLPPAASGELAALVDRLAGGPRASLLHGDPCSGNLLTAGRAVRFVDFEQAALGDGAAELSYLRIGFPTCGLTPAVLPADVARAEEVYAGAWRAAGGLGEPGSVVDQCVGWLLRGDALVQRAERGRRDQFARLLAEDWHWGPDTGRERLVRRLDVVGELATERMPAAAAVARALGPRVEALTR